jgi:sulfoxide reductase heme-binding subunit YedZ
MFAVEDVHRYGGLLVGTFIAIHVVTIGIDSFLPFSLTQLAVPLADGYRPIWTGLGIAAAELLLALAITNHYRMRISHRLWRRAHYANFAVWAAAAAGIGRVQTETRRMLAIYIVSMTWWCRW